MLPASKPNVSTSRRCACSTSGKGSSASTCRTGNGAPAKCCRALIIVAGDSASSGSPPESPNGTALGRCLTRLRSVRRLPDRIEAQTLNRPGRVRSAHPPDAHGGPRVLRHPFRRSTNFGRENPPILTANGRGASDWAGQHEQTAEAAMPCSACRPAAADPFRVLVRRRLARQNQAALRPASPPSDRSTPPVAVKGLAGYEGRSDEFTAVNRTDERSGSAVRWGQCSAGTGTTASSGTPAASTQSGRLSCAGPALLAVHAS